MLDSVTICPPQLGQKAALWGLRHLGDWVTSERPEILRRRDAALDTLSALPGWRVLGAAPISPTSSTPTTCPPTLAAALSARPRC